MSLYSDVILRDAPVAYWQMGESSGTIADSSGNGNTGTNHGTLTYGQTSPIVSGGTAIKFDGSTADFQVPHAAGLAITGDITIEGWINPVALGNAWLINQGTTNVANCYGIQVANSTFRFRRGNGAADAQVNAAVLSTGTFTYFAITMAGTNVTIYFNGKSSTTGTINTTITDSGTATTIGGVNSIPQNALNAILAHIAIYNKALTAAQVANHYNAGIRAAMLNMTTSRGMLAGPNRGAVRIAQAGVA